MHPILCLVLAAVTALASPPPFDSTKAHAVDTLARAEIHSGSTPALSIGIVQDGLLVYARAFGTSDIAAHRRAQPSIAFLTGGVSEEFVSAAVLLLAQQKRLSPDEAVSRYVPEFKGGRQITIAQLLQHTSGLPQLSQLSPAHGAIAIGDVLKALDRVPVVAPPGLQFARNPVDDMLAAEIVQRVSGEPYSDLLQAQIFLPLIMNSTFLAGDQGADVNRARGYLRTSNRFVPAPAVDASTLFGSSDVVSTIDDLAKWDIGMPLLLNVDSVRTMWTAGNASAAAPYGMGWFIDQRGGHPYVWTSGSVDGYRAMNAVLPEEHIAVIVLANASSKNAAGSAVSPERLAAAILQIVDPLPAVSFQNATIERAAEWVSRLQSLQIDRTQLTPRFSQYLSDRVVIQADLKSEGPLQSLAPVESFTSGDDTVYVFDAKFRRGSLRYRFALTPDGKIDQLAFEP